MKQVENKYKIINRTTAYKATKVQVDKVRINLPNGNEVEWDVNVLPNMFYAVPIKDQKVIMVKEWRLGPEKFVTQFVAARCTSDNYDNNLKELKRELKEEIGLENGKFEKKISFIRGVHTSGEITYFFVEDFQIAENERDENEILEIVELPIKGLFNELLNNYTVTSDTLLISKILEEKYIV